MQLYYLGVKLTTGNYLGRPNLCETRCPSDDPSKALTLSKLVCRSSAKMILEIGIFRSAKIADVDSLKLQSVNIENPLYILVFFCKFCAFKYQITMFYD